MDTLIFLPHPQQIELHHGGLSVEPDRLIVLGSPRSSELLAPGRMLQRILATPDHMWRLSASGNLEDADVGAILAIEPTQVPHVEGYRLRINDRGIHLVGHDAAGVFHGIMTLKQIVRQCGADGGPLSLPYLAIEDWPDYPNRGVMLDISRDKVPRMETLFLLVDMLAEWKINQFQLYTEHTFAYRNHDLVWADASPMTGEQILELDAYCGERHVELVPNQNSFGHMERWLKHAPYRQLAELPEGGGTLAPLDSGSIDLISDLYRELLPHFSSRKFNVGCDETFDLGKGRSREACERLGTGRVYLDFLLKIHERVSSHGRAMMFWGDIVLKHPELIPELPKDMVALHWGYEADQPSADDCRRFADAGITYYICPGTAAWHSIIGRGATCLENQRTAARNGLTHGAVGYLNTDWGDCGHWQHFPISWLGYAYGAALSWSCGANLDLDVPRAIGIHAFLDPSGEAGRVYHDLQRASTLMGVKSFNRNVLSQLLMTAGAAEIVETIEVDRTTDTLEAIEALASRLGRLSFARPDSELIVRELRNGCGLAAHACRLGRALLNVGGRGIAGLEAAVRHELARDLDEELSDYRALWLARNREGGLADSLARFQPLRRIHDDP